jgi:hypothetical protein
VPDSQGDQNPQQEQNQDNALHSVRSLSSDILLQWWRC